MNRRRGNHELVSIVRTDPPLAQRPPGGERLTHNVRVQTFHNRKSQSLWAVGFTAWIRPITLNVAHESPTKSSAR
jgi:hypothetical protein